MNVKIILDRLCIYDKLTMDVRKESEMRKMWEWMKGWFVKTAPESLFLKVMAGDYSAFLEGGVV
jgi:hypothetical protein